MTYTQGGLIEARDFNSKAQYINNVWGPGSGSSGYGQPNLLTSVSVYALVSATNWSTLITRLDLITQHQTGVTTSITRPVTGDLVAFINTLNSKISSVVSNKLHTNNRGTSLPTALGNPASSKSIAWTANAIKEFTVSFDSGDKLRYFFNCGGLITFYMSLIGGDNQKSTNVAAFLTTQIGTISFGSNTSFRSGNGGYGTIDNNTLGYWRLDNFYQTIFSGVSTLDSYYQSTGFYTIIEARKGDAANNLSFKISLFDPSPDSFTNAVDGTLNLYVGYTPPETTYLVDVWGTPTLTMVTDTQGPAPVPPPTYTIVPDITSVNEGQTVTYTVTTTNYGNGTLFWKDIAGRPAQDYVDQLKDDSVRIIADKGAITRTPAENFQTDTPNNLIIQLRLYDGNTDAAKLLASASDVTINDTSLTPVPGYSINPDTLFADEGSTVIFTVTTTFLPNNTTLYWTTNGTATAADFQDAKDSGTVNIINNTGTIPRPILADHLTEGPETFLIQLRKGSVTGDIVATSPAVTINDTSAYDPGPPPPPPVVTYTITPDKTSVNEGDTVTYTITTTNFGRQGNGVLYWTNAGTTTAADFSDNQNSGAITITNNSGTLPRTLVNDATTEGSENIVIQLRSTSLTGSLVAIAPAVTVNDTSQTVIPEPIVLTAAINPATAQRPGVFTLSWTSQNADKITVSGTGSGAGSFTDTNGSTTFTETVPGSYTKTVTALSVANGKTSAGKDVSYTVTKPAVNVTYPPTAMSPQYVGGAYFTWSISDAYPNESFTFTTDNAGSGPGGPFNVDSNGAATYTTGDWGKVGAITLTVVFHFAQSGDVTKIIQLSAPATPPPPPTPRGTLLNTSCQGVDKYGSYADGAGGTYSSLIQSNSTDCGYVAPLPPPPPPPTPHGTFLRFECSGTDKYNVYADGAGGEYKQLDSHLSTDCGYTPPPPPPVYDPRGTKQSEECRGTDLWGIYADGNGGTYSALIEGNSTGCGYVPPPPPYVPQTINQSNQINATFTQVTGSYLGKTFKALKLELGDNVNDDTNGVLFGASITISPPVSNVNANGTLSYVYPHTSNTNIFIVNQGNTVLYYVCGSATATTANPYFGSAFTATASISANTWSKKQPNGDITNYSYKNFIASQTVTANPAPAAPPPPPPPPAGGASSYNGSITCETGNAYNGTVLQFQVSIGGSATAAFKYKNVGNAPSSAGTFSGTVQVRGGAGSFSITLKNPLPSAADGTSLVIALTDSAGKEIDRTNDISLNASDG